MLRAVFATVIFMLALGLALICYRGSVAYQAKVSIAGQQRIEAQTAPVKSRVLTLSTYTPADYHLTKVLIEYAKEIERETRGRIRIEIYPNETLTKAAQTFDGVVKGIADIGFTLFSYNTGRFPLMEVVDLPLPGVKDSTQASLMAWEVYRKFKPKELDRIKLLGMLSLAGGTLYTSRAINRLEDVAGLRIRCTGNDVAVIEALGGKGVAMPITEAHVALQKGIVDGILTDDAAMMSYGFGDVVKNKVVFAGGLRQATIWYGMNLDVWNSLDPADRGIIFEASTRYMKELGDCRNEENRKGADYLARTNIKVNKLAPEEIARWHEALRPVRERYVKEKTAMGLPAEEALEFAIKTLQGGESP